jgi:hypothetical protein
MRDYMKRELAKGRFPFFIVLEVHLPFFRLDLSCIILYGFVNAKPGLGP